MKKQLLTALGLAVTAMTFSSGCLVISDGDRGQVGCYEDCYDYQVCETYCDAWECWDECWYETSCDVQCPDPQPGTPAASDCLCDIDCAQGDICIGGTCVAPSNDSNDNAEAGLCQACESTHDCVEDDARCIRLNYEHATKTGEKICSRICELDDDCPIGFECVNVSQEVGVPAQCLPKAGSDGDRTCTNNAELECVKAKECGVGESCVNNECTAPSAAECSDEQACGAGQVCRDFKCIAEETPECIDRNDCAADEICIDGACAAQNDSCVFNSECDNGKCVDGECIAGCSENADCGPYERCRKPEGGAQGLCEAIECRRTSDCEAGQVCVDAVCETSCSDSSPCDNGYQCNSNDFCERDPSVECLVTAECGADEICTGGACQTACGCNQDCPTEQVCNLETGACEQPGTSEPAQSCNTTCDCPSGQSCDEGVCK